MQSSSQQPRWGVAQVLAACGTHAPLAILPAPAERRALVERFTTDEAIGAAIGCQPEVVARMHTTTAVSGSVGIRYRKVMAAMLEAAQ